jgi:hypothetical protein
MNALLIIFFVAFACVSSSKETRKDDVETQSTVDTEKRTEKGPTLEFDFEPEGPVLDHHDGLPAHRALKSAVVHGPTTEDLVSLSRAQSKEHEEASREGKTAPALSCAFGGWLWLGVLGAALYFAFRILKRVP